MQPEQINQLAAPVQLAGSGLFFILSMAFGLNENWASFDYILEGNVGPFRTCVDWGGYGDCEWTVPDAGWAQGSAALQALAFIAVFATLPIGAFNFVISMVNQKPPMLLLVVLAGLLLVVASFFQMLAAIIFMAKAGSEDGSVSWASPLVLIVGLFMGAFGAGLAFVAFSGHKATKASTGTQYTNTNVSVVTNEDYE